MCRYHSTQLVLWPNLRVSFAAIHDSPVLQDMVFTGPSCTVYTHTTHRLFPLKTSSQAGAELTEISSTVSGEDRESCSTPLDTRSTPASVSNSPLHTITNTSAPGASGGSGALGGSGAVGGSGTLGAVGGRDKWQKPVHRNGLTESLQTPSPSSSSCLLRQNSLSSLSRTKLSSSPTRHATGSTVTQNGHMDDGVEEDEGEIEGRPCNQTTNELLEGPRKEVKDKSATDAGCSEGRHLYCVPTHMPRFLLAYTPSVSMYRSMRVSVAVCLCCLCDSKCFNRGLNHWNHSYA